MIYSPEMPKSNRLLLIFINRFIKIACTHCITKRTVVLALVYWEKCAVRFEYATLPASPAYESGHTTAAELVLLVDLNNIACKTGPARARAHERSRYASNNSWLRINRNAPGVKYHHRWSVSTQAGTYVRVWVRARLFVANLTMENNNRRHKKLMISTIHCP